MDELGVPTPRSRSRSKTPFVLRSQCDKEHCTDVDHVHAAPVRKVPSVPIVEEEELPTTPSNVRTSARTTRKTIVAETVYTTTSSSSSSSNITNSTATSSGGTVHRSTVKASTSSGAINGGSGSREPTLIDLSTKEMNQNELNSMFEENSRIRLRTSTPIQSTTTSYAAAAASSVRRAAVDRTKISVSLSDDGNDHVPYREYRDAGEYWNKYPKTDYTYSRLSPHRRELAPGVIAMPNMSRRSLDHHHERVNTMAQNAPGRESYIRTRYQATNYQTADQRRNETYYDSQESLDEVDGVQRRSYGSRSTSTWRFTDIRIVRWLTTIVTTLWSSSTSVFRRSDAPQSTLYYTRLQHEQEGWFRRLYTAITASFLNVFRYVYLVISTVLFFDTWLLSSNSGPNKKRFLLLLLVLLPLLLLGGLYYLNDIPFPPVNIVEEYVSLDRVIEAVQWEHVQTLAKAQYDRIAVASSTGWSHANELWFSAYETVVALAKENLGI